MRYAVDVWDHTGNKITLKATATTMDILAALWQMHPEENVYMARHRRPDRVRRMRAAYRARHR